MLASGRENTGIYVIVNSILQGAKYMYALDGTLVQSPDYPNSSVGSRPASRLVCVVLVGELWTILRNPCVSHCIPSNHVKCTIA